ncbi:hypothetical protein ACIPF8_21395 [Collimonas sp. NPDC087041]|uniref:hypothetical protein n=1 Tax=Collimonas sp. NPDC087041 TaxID=3363960 RepID=UPI0037F8922D
MKSGIDKLPRFEGWLALAMWVWQFVERDDDGFIRQSIVVGVRHAYAEADRDCHVLKTQHAAKGGNSAVF